MQWIIWINKYLYIFFSLFDFSHDFSSMQLKSSTKKFLAFFKVNALYWQALILNTLNTKPNFRMIIPKICRDILASIHLIY